MHVGEIDASHLVQVRAEKSGGTVEEGARDCVERFGEFVDCVVGGIWGGKVFIVPVVVMKQVRGREVLSVEC